MPRVTKNSAGAEKSPMRCMVLELGSLSSQRGISYWTRFNLQVAGEATLSSGLSSPRGDRGSPCRGVVWARSHPRTLTEPRRGHAGRHVSGGNIAVKTRTSLEFRSNPASHSATTPTLIHAAQIWRPCISKYLQGPLVTTTISIVHLFVGSKPPGRSASVCLREGTGHNDQVKVGITHSQTFFRPLNETIGQNKERKTNTLVYIRDSSSNLAAVTRNF